MPLDPPGSNRDAIDVLIANGVPGLAAENGKTPAKDLKLRLIRV